MAESISPLPYIYDETDERVTSILEIVKTFCNIDEQQEELPSEPEKLWPLIWQVLRTISNLTCWDDNPEDTFILQERVQFYDTTIKCGCSTNCCQCDKDYLIIPLEYAPFLDGNTDPFISGEITVMWGGSPQVVILNAGYLNSHLNRATNKLYIPRADFPGVLLDGTNCCCLCEHIATVTLRYNAGYATIPNGLLPVICFLLGKTDDGTLNDDCHDNMTNVSGALKRKKVGNVEYEWSTNSTPEAKTNAILSDIYDIGLVDEVLSISRCYLSSQTGELGDVL